MATVWITFATEDNVDGDIDYLAQEIGRCGWKTRQHPMFPGEDDKLERLMPAFLARPEQSDAWIFYGSENALAHGRNERIAGLVQRAIDARGSFTRIGVFPGARMASLDLTHRVSVDDPAWRNRIGEALGCDLTRTSSEGLPSYVAKILPATTEPYRYSFECRPKMGRWNSFVFAVLPEERARVGPAIPTEDVEQKFSDDAEWYMQVARRAATPNAGYSVLLRELPTRMAFGEADTDEVVIVNFSKPS